MRKITLELEISIGTLANCIQVVQKFGDVEEAEKEELGDILIGVVESFLEGMDKDGYIDLIRSNEDAERILGPFLASDEEKNLLSEIQESLSSRSSPREALPIPVVSEKKLLEEEEAEAAEEVPSEVEAPLPDIQTQLLKNLNVPDDDPLLLECRGDVSKEKALFAVYSVVKRDAWGSDMAHALLKLSLSPEKK